MKTARDATGGSPVKPARSVHPPRGVKRWLPGTLAAATLGGLLYFDQPLYEATATSGNTLLHRFTDLISHLRGEVSGYAAGIVVLGIGLFRGQDRFKKAGLIMLLAVTLAMGAVIILKPVMGRPGPKGFRPHPVDAPLVVRRWGRFPSGHTAATFAASAGLAAVSPPLAAIGYGMGLIVAYERVYRGIHYPSDCFAGAWLGILAARLARRRLQHGGPPNNGAGPGAGPPAGVPASDAIGRSRPGSQAP